MDVEQDWLDLVAQVLATPLTRLPEERLAAALMSTFDAPACAFHNRTHPDTVVQRLYPHGLFSAARQAEWLRLCVEAPRSHPLINYYLCTGDTAPRQVVDVPARFAAPGERARWVELGRVHGFEHQLAIPLPASTGGARWFVLGRPEPFDADRMWLARRLQQLIIGLDRQVTALTRVATPPDAAGIASDVGLTPRELAVLGLVGDGLTAAAAARRLAVAERTVHKHLQRAYAKLGVSDRVSAVLRAQRLGVLLGNP